MKKLKHLILFESFTINEAYESIDFETFKKNHPIGSKFEVVYTSGPKYGDKEICEIVDYIDDPKGKNVIYKDSKDKKVEINHNNLYNLEQDRVDLSSNMMYIKKWL
jgi:hypothetical protein